MAIYACTVGACAAACNPFVENYRGERWPPVPRATVLEQPPATDQADRIGTSEFRSTDIAIDGRLAAEAARAVGADLVTWGARSEGQQTVVEAEPIYLRNPADRGTFATYVAVPRSTHVWLFRAEFFRSRPGVTVSPAPPAVPAPAGPTAGPPSAVPSPPPAEPAGHGDLPSRPPGT
jgi:hypothetical protein